MFHPSKEILKKYADVMVNFALNKGEGINKGDVVCLQFETPAFKLALEVYREILKAGGHPIIREYRSGFSKAFYEEASDDQLDFFPDQYQKALVDTIDHRVFLIADDNPHLLKDIDPKKIMKKQLSAKALRKWLDDKEDAGNLTWSLCQYGTQALADEAGLTLEEYWEQIIDASFLNEEDPVAVWKKKYEELEIIRTKLNDLKIKTIRVESEGTDLTIQMGEKRKFIGGSGANIPSFELFTSPDWRGTEGHISFDQPLYRYGNIIKDIYLEFKDGKVVKATASENESVLKEMIATENADKVGEFSLTDKRFSRINKFMANTLYDENFGGEFGNTHIAVGKSYHDTFDGDSAGFKDEDWEKLGFNESVVHTDIIATKDRVVTATLESGEERVIYRDGMFQI